MGHPRTGGSTPSSAPSPATVRMKRPYALMLFAVMLFLLPSCFRLQKYEYGRSSSPSALHDDSSSPQAEDDDDCFRDLGLRTRGDGWEMWDRSRVLAQDSVTCIWTRYRPKLKRRNAEAENGTALVTHLMCIYPTNEDNYVSRSVRDSGSWGDCAGIVDLWNEYHNATTDTGDFYFDIGANIGTCVVEMLLTTDARIVAFEPDPRNLAQLTSTLMSMPASYRDRVALFPVALGASSYVSYVFQATNNRGHTMVGDRFAPEQTGQKNMPPLPVHVEPLDSIVTAAIAPESSSSSPSPPTRLFVKMDVQGFECNAMDGGQRTFRHLVRVLKTEEEVPKLVAQNCSGEGLTERIARAGLALTATRQGSDIVAVGMEGEGTKGT